MKITSISLPNQLTDNIDQIARDAERSRSWVIRHLLSRAITGADRLRALEQIANLELEPSFMPNDDGLTAQHRKIDRRLPHLGPSTPAPISPSKPQPGSTPSLVDPKPMKQVER